MKRQDQLGKFDNCSGIAARYPTMHKRVTAFARSMWESKSCILKQIKYAKLANTENVKSRVCLRNERCRDMLQEKRRAQKNLIAARWQREEKAKNTVNSAIAFFHTQKIQLYNSVVENLIAFSTSTQFRSRKYTHKQAKKPFLGAFSGLFSRFCAATTELCRIFVKSFQHFLITSRKFSTLLNSFLTPCGKVYFVKNSVFLKWRTHIRIALDRTHTHNARLRTCAHSRMYA